MADVNCETWAEETRIFTVEFSTLIRLQVFTIKRWRKKLWFTHVPHIWMSFLNTRPCSSVGKESACSAGDQGSIPGSGRSPGEGNGNPLQYACLENHMTEEPGGLQPKGSQRVGHDWATSQILWWRLTLRSIVAGKCLLWWQPRFIHPLSWRQVFPTVGCDYQSLQCSH